MRDGSLFMWWLQKKREFEQQLLERPVLHAPIPENRPQSYEDPNDDDEDKEPRRVIIIDL